MKKYVILLRGINVGGKNKVSMKELKGLFEENGFHDVVTYINSGNIIFCSDDSDVESLQEKCKIFILERFKLNLAVMAISADDLCEALVHVPQWWGADEESKHNAIFVIPPAAVDEVLKEVGEIKPEYEKTGYFGRVIFWSAPVKTFSRTRWSSVVGSSVYDKITIRNANTFKKLVQLCKNASK